MADDSTVPSTSALRTTDLVLGGGLLATIVGFVAYATHHNRRQELEFDILRKDMQVNEELLDRFLPGYADALADEFAVIIAQRTPEEDEEIRGRVVEPWLKRGGKANDWSYRMFERLGIE